MGKKAIQMLFVTAVFAMFIGCAAQTPQKKVTLPLDVTPQVDAGQYVQDADILYVILDASSSVPVSAEDRTDVNVAKNIVSRMNQRMPDVKINSALRPFGLGDCLYNKETRLLYGLTRYNRDSFQSALDTITCVADKSPMETAIDAATEDLKTTDGNIALLIVSDGVGMGEAPIEAAKNMKETLGERLCIFTIFIGNNYEGETLMTKIAKVGVCGDMVREGDIAAKKDMSRFIEEILFHIYTDMDCDGVKDAWDKCPDTPKGTPVDGCGCPTRMDSDGDGVYDNLDKCPETPVGARVNAVGCWVLKNVLFDTDAYNIKPAFYSDLHEVVGVMEKNPDLAIEIQGHTDNVGSAEYNKALSQKRADAVMGYLVKKGVSPDRMTAVGYGLERPVASNDTEAGRAQNRRVQLDPVRR